ncbi:transmembrane protein, putative (macronuclear) [Tetrahymena thermophila SB210]|uniref:Transmembrane protein, putative n=1 Tax=Tetrahymena thermophila (strain SB210) TaxID=312017 RepID=I7M2H1_TETTS|nr:transmembrane protein, putative [Tetrahymena thermophila SB210]EAS00378.2 transmembrane protein, putative [Tetrahymena thermophila SB210]|eukprot:XP_001020623.2 transmembrane protein, putative [Tetrahymena thermophila SB210]
MLNFQTNKPKNLPPLPQQQPNQEKNNIFERKPLGPSNQIQKDQGPPSNLPKKNIELENVNNENVPPAQGGQIQAKEKAVKREKKQGIKKNITDNKIVLPQDISQEDRVGEDFNADHKDDNLGFLLKEKPIKGASYKEDLKTGKFIYISNKYMEQILDESKEEAKAHEGVEDEDNKWYKLIDDFNSMIYRFIFLLQGLLSGLLIMISITSFNPQWTSDSYRYRLNQIIWIIALICFFGQIYIYMVSNQRCEYSFTNGSPNLQEHKNFKMRALVNLIIYGVIYYCVMIAHYYVSMLTYTPTISDTVNAYDSAKQGYSYLVTISAVFGFFGWAIVGNQTKSNYVEMEYDDDDLTKAGDDSDEEI